MSSARDEVAGEEGDFSRLDRALEYLRSTTETPGLIHLYVDMLAAASDCTHPAAAFFEEHHARVARIIRATTGITDPSTVRTVIAAMEGLQIQWLRDHSVDIETSLRNLVIALARKE